MASPNHHFTPSSHKISETLTNPNQNLEKYSPMSISPNLSKSSPMETEQDFEHQPLALAVVKDQKQMGKGDEMTGISKGSTKKKFEEAKEDWVELGEPIPKTKSMAAERITMRSAKFLNGLCINLDWCKAIRYDELLEILEFQGWIKLLSVGYDNVLTYALMKEFCSNFTCEDGVCTSKVKNKPIEFDASVLAEAFEVPNEGFDAYFKGTAVVDVNGVKINKIVESIGGNAKCVQTNHNNFSPIQKVLFHLVFQAIVPRSQHRNLANHLDAMLIYCLENKIQINFPSLMIKHLTHCITNDLYIGYSNLIMTLLESFGISLTNHEHLQLQTNHFIQPSTLKSWNLCVENGKTDFFEKKEKPQKVAEVEKDEKIEDVSSKKRKAEKMEEKEVKEEEEQKVNKVAPKTKGKQGSGHRGKRKSLRLALKPTEKPSSDPTVYLINDEEDDKKEKGVVKKLFEQAKVTGLGFGEFSSSPTVMEELKSIKDMLGEVMKKQDELQSRMKDVEDVLCTMTESSLALETEVTEGMADISKRQDGLKNRLEEMVVENKTDEEDQDEETPAT